MDALEKIVAHIRSLLDEQKLLTARVSSLEEVDQEASSIAAFGPGNPIARQEYVAQVVVSTVVESGNFYYGKRLKTDVNSFWTVDTSLSPVVVRAAPSETLPSSGDMMTVQFLGEPIDSGNDPVPVYRQSAQPAAVTQFRLKTISGDYVTAVTFINSVEGPTYTIAKPWKLRRTPFDGQTVAGITYTYSDNVTRSATDGSDTETQVVVPEYQVDDIFYAQPVRGMGMSVGGNEVRWIDVNADGRAWAKDDS